MSDDISITGGQNIRDLKDSILAEIYIIYAEVGNLYKTATDQEFKNAMLAIKHCCDLAIDHLMPLDGYFDERFAELWTQFAD
ncbi:MAG TPA: hypothetical protein VIK35_11605 [Verrucomicrobiae bacterium]